MFHNSKEVFLKEKIIQLNYLESDSKLHGAIWKMPHNFMSSILKVPQNSISVFKILHNCIEVFSNYIISYEVS